MAARASRAGAHVDYMVGEFDHLAVVLDNKHGVPVVAQGAQRFFEQTDILRMEADAWFIENVGHVGERRVDIFGDLDALRLAA